MRKERKGLIVHCQIYPDTFNDKKHCLPNGKLKSRRPMPQIRASDFEKSLVKTKDGRWVFSGGNLNGWPALTNLEVVSVTQKYRSRIGGITRVRRHFQRGVSLDKPKLPPGKACRATLQLPEWSDIGWAKDVRGVRALLI